jgi:ribosomal-protein-alanine N-acetyltransferase
MLESLSIQTEALILRQLTPYDASKLFIMSQEAGIKKWIPDQVYHNKQQAREVINYLCSQYEDPGNPLSGPYVLGVCLAETQELVGHVGLSPFMGSVEIGYAIEDKYQRQGYATKAVNLMSEWGLQQFELSQILGVVSIDNIVSCRVLEGANFKLIEEVEDRLHHRQIVIRKYCKIP